MPAVNKTKLPALLPGVADATAANEIGNQVFQEPPKVAWMEEALWKERLIIPALEHPARTPARGGIIKEIAEQLHVAWDGQTVRFSDRAIREWVTAYEKREKETG